MMRGRIRPLGIIAVAFVLALALGYRLAQRSVPVPPPATPVVVDGGSIRDRSSSVARPAATLPTNIKDLDGRAFIDALPEVERRARNGDATATHLLFERLQTCARFDDRGELKIREQVDGEFQHQLEIQQRISSEHPEWKPEPQFVIDEDWHQRVLQQRLAQRERCLALTPDQVEGRFAWVRLALQRHDRGMIVAVSGVGQFSTEGAELVRNADQIAALRELERTELARLVESGDSEAIAGAAYAYSEEGNLLPRDLVQSYAHAYAWSRANAGEDTRGMSTLMSALASRSLTPQQVEQARTEGERLYQHCCRSGFAPSAH